MGHSGSGKSTIASVLLRLYDVQEGEVRIEGVDVRDMDVEDLRRRVSVVQQEPVLFSDSIEVSLALAWFCVCFWSLLWPCCGRAVQQLHAA